MPEDSPPPSSVRRVVGIILLALGIPLTVGSGLCTGIGMITMVGDGSGGEMSGGAMIGLMIFVGSLFFIPGALMWWGGVRLGRDRKLPDVTEDSNG